jgi:hypothetical protein
VEPRAGLETEKKVKFSCACQESNPGRPVLSGIYNYLDFNPTIFVEIMFKYGIVNLPSSTRCVIELSLESTLP